MQDPPPVNWVYLGQDVCDTSSSPNPNPCACANATQGFTVTGSAHDKYKCMEPSGRPHPDTDCMGPNPGLASTHPCQTVCSSPPNPASCPQCAGGTCPPPVEPPGHPFGPCGGSMCFQVDQNNIMICSLDAFCNYSSCTNFTCGDPSHCYCQ
jgi:hypothetical protein